MFTTFNEGSSYRPLTARGIGKDPARHAGYQSTKAALESFNPLIFSTTNEEAEDSLQ